jgi:hypothetical protein
MRVVITIGVMMVPITLVLMALVVFDTSHQESRNNNDNDLHYNSEQ